MAYVYQPYPKWVYYHKSPFGKIVKDRKEELDLLNAGWRNKPFSEQEKKEMAEAEVAPKVIEFLSATKEPLSATKEPLSATKEENAVPAQEQPKRRGRPKKTTEDLI